MLAARVKVGKGERKQPRQQSRRELAGESWQATFIYTVYRLQGHGAGSSKVNIPPTQITASADGPTERASSYVGSEPSTVYAPLLRMQPRRLLVVAAVSCRIAAACCGCCCAISMRRAQRVIGRRIITRITIPIARVSQRRRRRKTSGRR